jgi:hypothetical protein
LESILWFCLGQPGSYLPTYVSHRAGFIDVYHHIRLID